MKLKSSLWIYICGYLALFWAFSLIAVSFASFMHFSMSHELVVIEDWIYKNAWSLINLSKLVAFSIIFYFLTLSRSLGRITFEDIKKSFNYDRLSSFLAILIQVSILFLSVYFVFDKSILQWDFEKGQSVSMVIFFLIDAVLLYFLNERYLFVNEKNGTVALFVLPILLGLFYPFASPYTEGLIFYSFFYYFFIIYLIKKDKDNFVSIGLYCVLFVGLSSYVFELDLIREAEHMNFSQIDLNIVFLVATSLGVAFMKLLQKGVR